MKLLQFTRIGILLSVLLGSMTSCEKFSVLKDVKVDHQPAGVNLLNKTIWQFVSEDNFHQNDSTNIGLFGKAVERAGLKDLFNQPDANLTVVIPSNKALMTFVNSLGYSSMEEVPVVVLRNLILNDVIDTKVRSFDLDADVLNAYPTLSGDSLYLTRNVNTTNEYMLNVNATTTTNSIRTPVRSQNLEFKNGVAHVVDLFTYFARSTSPQDAVDYDGLEFVSDTLFVSKDTYTQNGSAANKNRNYGSDVEVFSKLFGATGSNANFTRRILTQYPVRQPLFNDEIGTVKLEFYMHYNTMPNGTSAKLSFFEDENVDWDELSVNWNNAPVIGSTVIGSLNLSADQRFRWHNIDLTAYFIQALSQGKSFINIGASIIENQSVGYRSKEFDSGNFRSRIVINSPPVTIISPENVKPIVVDKSKAYKTLTLDELKFAGTADKNITYFLKTIPQKGYLVLNGLPLSINSSFTQEQIAQGAVRFLHNDNASGADSFSVSPKDFQGGVYKPNATLNITIQ